jgi:hypothetical protein
MHHRRKYRNGSSPSTTVFAEDPLQMLNFRVASKWRCPLAATLARSVCSAHRRGPRAPFKAPGPTCRGHNPATALAPRGDRAAAAHRGRLADRAEADPAPDESSQIVPAQQSRMTRIGVHGCCSVEERDRANPESGIRCSSARQRRSSVRGRLLLRAWAVSGEAADFVDLDGFSACAPRPSGNSADYRPVARARGRAIASLRHRSRRRTPPVSRRER